MQIPWKISSAELLVGQVLYSSTHFTFCEVFYFISHFVKTKKVNKRTQNLASATSKCRLTCACLYRSSFATPLLPRYYPATSPATTLLLPCYYPCNYPATSPATTPLLPPRLPRYFPCYFPRYFPRYSKGHRWEIRHRLATQKTWISLLDQILRTFIYSPWPLPCFRRLVKPLVPRDRT